MSCSWGKLVSASRIGLSDHHIRLVNHVQGIPLGIPWYPAVFGSPT